MKASWMIIFTILAFSMSVTYGKTFNRCSLVQELNRLGVARADLARWACIAQRESSYRTSVIGRQTRNGSKGYGIFQIDDKLMCQPSGGEFSENYCQVSCSALLTDDIQKSVSCVTQLQRERGWTTKPTWRYCGKSLPSIELCLQ